MIITGGVNVQPAGVVFGRALPRTETSKVLWAAGDRRGRAC
jgi:hypothetical protein